MRDADYGSRAWEHVALLTDYASGLTQATRRGDAQSIRAGLRNLLATDRRVRDDGTATTSARQKSTSPGEPDGVVVSHFAKVTR